MADFPKKWITERTMQELMELRKATLFYFNNDEVVFTCDTCLDFYRCHCAFDAYNTEGDCLMVK